jgi:NAD(P)-dependent dehydrogenase (short-subunit alcohol dehydrogenase family)
LRAAYQRRGNLGTDDALATERAASSRREIAALFLASDEARYITGVALPVDAGNTSKP